VRNADLRHALMNDANLFQIDLPPSGGDGNESINWTLLGSGGSRGGSEVPEPASLILVGTGLVGVARRFRRR
jgi:hypothetical protein